MEPASQNVQSITHEEHLSTLKAGHDAHLSAVLRQAADNGKHTYDFLRTVASDAGVSKSAQT